MQYILDNTRFVAEELDSLCPAITRATELSGELCSRLEATTGPGDAVPEELAQQLRRQLGDLNLGEMSGRYAAR